MFHSGSIKVKLGKNEVLDITGKVEDILRKSGVENGLCSVFCHGSTGSVFINENEPMLFEDYRKLLGRTTDSKDIHQHIENAASHMSSILTGSNQTVPVRNGLLVLGTWQSILLANFDSKTRDREVIVTVIGE
jgi:secondary thiamine-phosphate synthase enzyme